MKNILIFGVARAGKTTLARMINKEFAMYQIESTDSYITVFRDNFKDMDINYIYDKADEKGNLALFTSKLLHEKTINRKQGNYILEGDSITPDMCAKYFNTDENIIYYILHNKLTAQEILNNCRKYDIDDKDWSVKVSDEDLLKHCIFNLKLGKEYEKQCINYKFRVIDTSFNRNQKLEETLSEISEYILKGK
ncbi:MAG: hypothetical protein RSB76_02225 [Clostridia bacterium]